MRRSAGEIGEGEPIPLLARLLRLATGAGEEQTEDEGGPAVRGGRANGGNHVPSDAAGRDSAGRVSS